MVDRLFRNLLIRPHWQHTPQPSSASTSSSHPESSHRPPRPRRDACLRDAAACAHESRPAPPAAAQPRFASSGSSPTRTASCAGAPTSTTAGCCRISTARISTTSSGTCAWPGSRSIRRGSITAFEFRFPRVGDFTVRDVHVELRTALRGHGTCWARNVRPRRDRALRGQLPGTPAGEGQRPDRRPLYSHGQRPPRARCSPPASTARASPACASAFLAAPECLQPTIPSHAPLVFDLVDTTRNKRARSAGAHESRVAHPGGLASYETFPVNSYEAESRRLLPLCPAGPHPRQHAPDPALHRQA